MFDSERPGPLGCSGALFLVGIWLFLCAVAFAVVIYPEWRVNHSYVEGTCLVLDKRIGVSTSTEDGQTISTYRPEVLIRYQVEGTEHTAWTYDAAGSYSTGRSGKEKMLQQFQVGQQYPFWYDPAVPKDAVLVRGSTWLIYVLLVPLPVIVAVLLVAGLRRLLTGGLRPS